MMDNQPAFDVFRCPACGKPTTESIASCRHCHASLRNKNSGEKTNRIFADEGPGAKWGCLGSAALLMALAGGGIAFCNHEFAERARIESERATAEKKEEAARYQDRVRSGQVCADGPNDLNTALQLSVKRSLKDPDSFEHIGTVIKPAGDGVTYDALMRYRVVSHGVV